MHILYLSSANVADRLFLKEFYARAARLQGPALVVHQSPNTTPEGYLFAAKRVSGQLSEAMVTNMVLPGPQRSFLSGQPVQVRAELLHRYWTDVQTIVTYPLTEEGRLVDETEMLAALQQALPDSTVTLFTQNPMAALGGERPQLTDTAIHNRLLAAYAEEQAVLDLALALGARICSPMNYAD